MKQVLLLFCFIIVFLTLTIHTSVNILEKVPHSQDETAYLFQAQIFKSGHLYLRSLPGELRRFFDQEFIINNGKWFSKYPPGQPAVLAIGLLFNKPWLVNPFFGVSSVITLFYITKQLFSLKTALITIGLFSTSPFFILQSASFLSHTPALFFTLLTLLGFFNWIYPTNRCQSRWLIGSGISLGILFLFRPYNIISLIIFLLFCQVYLVKINLKSVRLLVKNFLSAFAEKSDGSIGHECEFSASARFCSTPKKGEDIPTLRRGASYLAIPLGAFIVLSLIYNQQLTGSFLISPLNLYSPYDQPGFGSRGVEWGLDFTIKQAITNLLTNLLSLKQFLLATPLFYLTLLIPLAFFSKKRAYSILLLSFLLLHILAYFFYFHPGTFLGPRYWLEASWVICVLIGEGITTLVSFLNQTTIKKINNIRYLLPAALIIIWYLIFEDLIFISKFKDYNDMSKVTLPALSHPSLIFIPSQDSWTSYGRYFYLQDPDLKRNQVIFARDRAIHNVPKNELPLDNSLLMKYFPNRDYYLLETSR